MYSIHNEGKYVVAERFIGILKTKIYKFMASILNNVYINKVDDIVNEYNNNVCYRTIKMKPVDVKDNTYIDFKKEVNDKYLKFKVDNQQKNIFTKGSTPNCSEEVFVIKKVKNTVPWTYVIKDLNDEETIGTFYEKELLKTNQQQYKIGKVIKKKSDKLYVEWKGYDSSFNSWINKKDLA